MKKLWLWKPWFWLLTGWGDGILAGSIQRRVTFVTFAHFSSILISSGCLQNWQSVTLCIMTADPTGSLRTVQPWPFTAICACICRQQHEEWRVKWAAMSKENICIGMVNYKLWLCSMLVLSAFLLIIVHCLNTPLLPLALNRTKRRKVKSCPW